MQAAKQAGADTFVARIGGAPASCTYQLSASGASLGAGGGSGSVGVTTATGCVWTATSNVPWLRVTSSGSGVGSGVLDYSADPNLTAAGRSGTLHIANVTYTVVQTGIVITSPSEPAGSTVAVAGTSYAYTASGATVSEGGLEYRFDWGDGRYSSWVIATATVLWPSTGTYQVRAQARSAAFPTIVSAWSSALAVTTVADSVVVTDQEFVERVFLDFLHRPADPGALALRVSQLSSGDISRADLIVINLASAEYREYGSFITRCYLGILDRRPDFGGWVYWNDLMHAGFTQQDVANIIIQSPEFQQTYGSLDNAALVTLMYLNILGREPDAGGLAYYVNLLDSGVLTRAALVLGFLNSPEYIQNSQNETFANGLILGMWRRTSTILEESQWTSLLSIMPLVTAAEQFLESDEYLARFLL